MLNVADDQANDTVPSDPASVDFIQAMHDKELLHKCHHVYHIGVLLLPLCKCRLCLHSAQILERNVHLKLGELVFELDDGNARRDDQWVVVGRQPCVFEPSGCLVEQTLVGPPRRHVDNGLSTIVVSIRDIYQIHVGRGQVKTRREGAETQDASVFLREPALSHSAINAVD